MNAKLTALLSAIAAWIPSWEAAKSIGFAGGPAQAIQDAYEDFLKSSPDPLEIVGRFTQREIAENAAAHTTWVRAVHYDLLREELSREGWKLLPEDCETHLADWHRACEIAMRAAKEYEDISYWAHQLTTIERIQALLSEAPKP